VATLGDTSGNALTPEVQSAVANIVKASLDAALAPLVTRINSQSGIIEKLRKGHTDDGSSLTGDEPPAKGKQPDGLEARLKALEEREREQTSKEQAMTRRQTVAGLARALAKSGVQPMQAEDLAEVLVMRGGDKFKMDESGNVTVREGDAEALPVAAWAGLFMASERGKAYLPAQQNPKLGDHGRGPVPVPTRTVTKEQLERGEVSSADLLAGKVALAD
jgi:hypothetical protein